MVCIVLVIVEVSGLVLSFRDGVRGVKRLSMVYGLLGGFFFVFVKC